MDQKPNDKATAPPPQHRDGPFEGRNVARATIGEAIVEFLPELTQADLRVLLVHLLRFNGSAGSSYPGTASVARMTGLGESSVRRARRKLCGLGLMQVHTPARGASSARYSMDECLRMSDSYRNARAPATLPEAMEDAAAGGATENLPPGAAQGGAGGVSAAAASGQPEKPAHGDTAARMAAWLANRAGMSAPSANQVEILRKFMAQNADRLAGKIDNQQWCDTMRARAVDFMSKSERRLGLMKAWVSQAEAELNQETAQAAGGPVKFDSSGNVLLHGEERMAFERREREIQKLRSEIGFYDQQAGELDAIAKQYERLKPSAVPAGMTKGEMVKTQEEAAQDARNSAAEARAMLKALENEREAQCQTPGK